MPSRAAALDRNALLLERAEDRAARDVAAAYNAARRELVDYLLSRWTGSAALLPRDAVDLFRRLALLSGIDERLRELERQTGTILRGVVSSQAELALEQLGREMALLPPSYRASIGSFAAIEAPLIETFLPAVLADAQAAPQAILAQLTRELQNGLIQGESFPDLVRRLLAAAPTGTGPAVWRNGELSAELMVRRTVITAANQAKLGSLNAVNARGETKVRKQAIASIGPNTTRCCLAVHGQIRDVDEPFELTAEPRFARQMQSPAFHWRCRTSIAMYHPLFERGGLTTSNMRSSAQAELRRRAA